MDAQPLSRNAQPPDKKNQLAKLTAEAQVGVPFHSVINSVHSDVFLSFLDNSGMPFGTKRSFISGQIAR